jgi:FMN phosphatase YigB (HAD superfamily)/DNA-binding XRE family transcriptional regulator
VAVIVDEKALGKRLQMARRRAGLTQQELCHKAKLSYSTLAKIERGAIRSPSVFTVSSIAQATGTTVESLLGIKSSSDLQKVSPLPKKVSKTGIKFVYFDVNGVLVRFYHRAFTRIAQDSGKSSDIVETLFWRHNDAACKGLLTPAQFNDILGKEVGMKGLDWQRYYLDNAEAMPGIKELVEWTAKYYNIGLFSNSMSGFIDELRNAGDIPDVNYTAIVDSSKVGAIKPEAKIYQVAEQLTDVKPNEILMIDDSRANLTAADKLGWHVLWFDDYRPSESINHIREALAF